MSGTLSKSRNPHTPRRRRRRAFTLIEVLVVVAIIALLVAILLPSLSQARDLARLATCKANCKQAATMIATYQSECRGYVPILLNYYADGNPNYVAPAQNCMLSLALRAYDKGIARIKQNSSGYFDPGQWWDSTKKAEYINRLLPEFFRCPFERGKGKQVRTTSVDLQFRYQEVHGRYEAYQTVLWPYTVIRGTVIDKPWPPGGRALDGVAKYSSINWNQVQSGADIKQGSATRDGLLSIQNRRWTDRDAQGRRRSAGLSELSIVYCAQGEHMVLPDNTSVDKDKVWRENVGSHRTTGGGGTNVIFGDTHVEWVQGTRVGWP